MNQFRVMAIAAIAADRGPELGRCYGVLGVDITATLAKDWLKNSQRLAACSSLGTALLATPKPLLPRPIKRNLLASLVLASQPVGLIVVVDVNLNGGKASIGLARSQTPELDKPGAEAGLRLRFQRGYRWGEDHSQTV